MHGLSSWIGGPRRGLKLTCTAIAVALIAGTSVVLLRSPAPAPPLTAALRALADGDLDTARFFAERDTAERGETAGGARVLGLIAAGRGDLDTAASQLRRSLELEPRVRTRIELAEAELRRGRPAEAVAEAERAVLAGTGDGGSEFLLALARACERGSHDLDHDLRAAVAAGLPTDPARVMALAELALSRVEPHQQLSPATAGTSPANAPTNPLTNPTVHTCLVSARESLAAQGPEPGSAAALLIGRIDLALGNVSSARARVKALLATSAPPAATHILAARVALRAGDRRAARTAINAWLSAAPDLGDVTSDQLMTAGLLALAAGAQERARSITEALIDRPGGAWPPATIELAARLADARPPRSKASARAAAEDPDAQKQRWSDRVRAELEARVAAGEDANTLQATVDLLAGRAALAAGRAREARRRLESAVTRLPAEPVARLLLAACHRFRRAPRAEFEELTAALQLTGPDAAILRARADCARRMGASARARRDLATLLALGAEDVDTHVLAARVDWQDSKMVAAHLRRAAAVAQSRPLARALEGLARLETGSGDSARAELSLAIGEGVSTRRYIALLKLFDRPGRPAPDLDAAFEVFIERRPAVLPVQLALADRRLARAEIQLARDQLERAAAKIESAAIERRLVGAWLAPPAHTERGNVPERATVPERGNVPARATVPERAKFHAERVRALAPDTADDFYVRGRLALHAGHIGKAAPLLAQAARRGPRNARYLIWSGVALLHAGRPGAARGPLLRALALRPGLQLARRARAAVLSVIAPPSDGGLPGVEAFRLDPSAMRGVLTDGGASSLAEVRARVEAQLRGGDDTADAWSRLVLICRAQEDLAGLRAFCTARLADDATSHSALVVHALALAADDRELEGARTLEPHLAAADADGSLALLTLRLLHAAGQGTDALALCERLRLHERAAGVANAAGEIAAAEGRAEAAEHYFNAALDLIARDGPSPGAATAARRLVTNQLARRMIDQAHATARRLPSEGATRATRELLLGLVELRREKTAESGATRLRNVARDSTAPVVTRLSAATASLRRALRRGQAHDPSETDVDLADSIVALVEREPTCRPSGALRTPAAQSCVAAGHILLTVGDTPGARGAYRAALARNPREFDALNNLADSLASMPATAAEAVDLARRATEAEPARPEAWDTLGSALFATRRLGEARDAFQTALNRYQTSDGVVTDARRRRMAPVRLRLALVRATLGEAQAARTAYAWAIRVAPSLADTTDGRAVLLALR